MHPFSSAELLGSSPTLKSFTLYVYGSRREASEVSKVLTSLRHTLH